MTRFPQRRPRRKADRNAATMLALAGLVAAGFGLLLLGAMVLPQIQGIILVVGAFGGILALHYLTWGRWLSRMRSAEQPEADAPKRPFWEVAPGTEPPLDPPPPWTGGDGE